MFSRCLYTAETQLILAVLFRQSSSLDVALIKNTLGEVITELALSLSEKYETIICSHTV